MGHYHLRPYRAGFAVEQGQANGCPFCLARQNHRPAVGSRIFLLSGGDVGQAATVIEPDDAGNPCIRMDYDSAHTYRLASSNQLFIEGDSVEAPSWMVPLSIDDAGALHEQILEGLRDPLAGSRRKAVRDLMSGIAVTCWSHRLKLSAAEVWAMLAAHGSRPELKATAADF